MFVQDTCIVKRSPTFGKHSLAWYGVSGDVCQELL